MAQLNCQQDTYVCSNELCLVPSFARTNRSIPLTNKWDTRTKTRQIPQIKKNLPISKAAFERI